MKFIENNFEYSYLGLGDLFYKYELPTKVREPRLIKFNFELAQELGINEYTNIEEFLSGNKIPDNITPFAMAYCGHQFGHLNVLGDGRVLNLGELNGYDVQLKGAGRTNYSRGGDGRAAIGPVLREYLVSETMHKFGVPTTRALAFVTTGEYVYREEALQGAILTRTARSHLRIGTFTYAKLNNEVKPLADYAINRLYPEVKEHPNKYRVFFEAVCNNQAKLIAKWMSLGFIHGVMNTDNMTISGETLDYGPCAFMDEYNSEQVYSFIDKKGRYAYKNQPFIAAWNLARLAESLLELFDDDIQNAVDYAQDYIGKFHSLYESYFNAEFSKKLGFKTPLKSPELINEFLDILETNSLDFTNNFRNLNKIINLEVDGIFKEWAIKWRTALNDETGNIIERLNKANPFIIPRNHLIEKAINAAENGDFSLFHELYNALQNPFEENNVEFSHPPKLQEKIKNTFCGT